MAAPYGGWVAETFRRALALHIRSAVTVTCLLANEGDVWIKARSLFDRRCVSVVALTVYVDEDGTIWGLAAFQSKGGAARSSRRRNPCVYEYPPSTRLRTHGLLACPSLPGFTRCCSQFLRSRSSVPRAILLWPPIPQPPFIFSGSLSSMAANLIISQ